MRSIIKPVQSVFVVAALAMALGITGCSISLDHDPEKSVTVEITEIPDQATNDELPEKLTEMVEGGSSMMTSFSSGTSSLTVTLSPVPDANEFAKKIDFGEVNEVKDKTIKVTYGAK
ncbi:hypothetical protein SV7mr_23790 [Stieleria bergensis]|uniref:Uncharacterized protein n=1 Tax=Stieleria bergensis TaxID=2528025 RepID=A0A517SUR2_9BACT|nr:MAG: hypothetical protein CBB71_18750 [Rhodopirellula sp. TMED11]QDT59867.1 hypothetical protein SV7mr_23790 [Planctomycetes bacterium SV_7m_r]